MSMNGAVQHHITKRLATMFDIMKTIMLIPLYLAGIIASWSFLCVCALVSIGGLQWLWKQGTSDEA